MRLRHPGVAALVCVCLAAGPHAVEAQERTTLGGYGEIHYTNRTGPATPGEVTFRRFVLYLAHTFTERIVFRSEVEIEDARVEGAQPGGEIALEQAFLDYRVSDRLTLRSGLVLPPVGIINETHEPPTFNGVDRPAFDHDVIPTTWREIGVGALGPVPGVSGLSYRLYLVNGLKAEGFSDVAGIREGRQEGQQASFANPSLTGRLEWAGPGLKIGGSFWYGGTANQEATLGTGAFAAPVTLISADVRWEAGPITARGVVVNIGVPDAAAINARFGGAVGTRIAGGYLEAAYDLLDALAPASSHRLYAFARHERYDTQADVAPGAARNAALDRRITTLGVSYKPIYNVVFKSDYMVVRNRARTGGGQVVSAGVGYQF